MRTEFLMPPLLVSDYNMINFSKTNFARSDKPSLRAKILFLCFYHIQNENQQQEELA
jgi:hypothetical protein